MPTDLKCDWCDWTASVGSYHGFRGNWFNALYCRECGLRQLLETTIEIGNPLKSEQSLSCADLLPDSMNPESVRCRGCATLGPIGRHGPITDEVPTSCPKCKLGAVSASGFWRT
jgi:hypothetical protein